MHLNMTGSGPRVSLSQFLGTGQLVLRRAPEGTTDKQSLRPYRRLCRPGRVASASASLPELEARPMSRGLRNPGREDLSQYPPGSILRIHVKDFLTYANATFVAGPKLNLVIGPNGSGKSSLVSAICLGLGGEPKLLSRASATKDFVRHTCDEAVITVLVSNGPDKNPTKVQRRIHAQAGTQRSTFKIDDYEATLEEVRRKCRDWNIQLDNLCQFLPQDRVVEFARLSGNPEDLLLQTERAVGNGELHQQHTHLIETKDNFDNACAELTTLEKQVEKDRNRIETLFRDTEAIRQRVHLQEQVKLCEAKVEYLTWLEARAKHAESESMLQKAQAKFEEVQGRQQAALTGPQARRQQELAELKRAWDGKHARVLKLRKEVDSRASELDRAQQKVASTLSSLSKLGQLSQDWQDKKRRLEREVEEAERGEREREPPPPVDTARLDWLNRTLKDKRVIKRQTEQRAHDKDRRCQELSTEIADLQTQLSRTSNQSVRRVQKLGSILKAGGELQAAFHWVNENAREGNTLFKGPVYGPILAHVHVSDPRLADMLAHAVKPHIWARFLVTCPEDRDTLERCLNEHLQGAWRPDVTSAATRQSSEVSHPLGHAREYQGFKVQATLDAALEAPPTIKAMLCDFANINQRLVFRQDATLEDARRLVEARPNLQQGRMMVPNAELSFTRSRYGGAESAAMAPIRYGWGEYLLGGESDQDRADREALVRCIEEKERELREEREGLTRVKEEVAAMEREMADVQREADGLVDQQRRAEAATKSALGAVATCKAKLNVHLQTQDPITRQGRNEEELRIHVQAFVKAAANLAATADALAEAQRDQDVLAAQTLSLKRVAVEDYEQAKVQSAAVKKAAQKVQQVQTILEEDRMRLVGAQEAWLHKAPMGYRLGDDLDAADPESDLGRAAAAMRALPVDVEGLEEHMDQLTAQVRRIRVENPGAENQYRELQGALENKLATMAAVRKRVGDLREDMDATHRAWLPALQRRVDLIHETFQRDFESIGVAGQVSLVPAGENGQDYAKYRLEIKVKFRAKEELHVLSHDRQSGGERSVSTIAFLVALQGVTRTPFRVVDEINQGMDPVNERKIYNLLVRTASEEGTPQCFLLTPKLLPNLPYGPSVTVQNIFSGPLVEKVCPPGTDAPFSIDALMGAAALRAAPAMAS